MMVGRKGLSEFCLEERLMRIAANLERFRNSRRPHGGDDYAVIADRSGLDTHDVHDAREIVGEYVHCHLGAWQRLHQEVGCSHPRSPG